MFGFQDNNACNLNCTKKKNLHITAIGCISVYCRRYIIITLTADSYKQSDI